ncbi:DNA ligase [Paenibacillus lupini]|uniref:ATP-dependent DNA ligase n=1 Tax=Paenibacillus lupini TaxID=1450204 RepID=UPI00142405C7|nr:DNA ligase [Paenibacillus lupini]NIK24122.1 bifunctional non-homologous end joining protein LigD [Paenibacillus lupini]
MAAFVLPSEPMIPIADDRIPEEPGWIYQIKWDGVRIVSTISEDGHVDLYSRRLLNKNNVYPEIHRTLQEQASLLGPCMLDGEIVYWDGERPNFQMVLTRERSFGSEPSPSTSKGRVLYVLFDLLQDGEQDLRLLPYAQRHERMITKLKPVHSDRLLTADLYTDADSLWKWVDEHQWEGIVSKRLDSPYKEGKAHRDWLKKKRALLLDVGIVGVKRREGRAASLIMADQGRFIGSVSLGLDDAMRELLGEMLQLRRSDAPSWPMPFDTLPSELKGESIIWLPSPMPCRVTGLELTSAGLLRHPKLVSFGAGGRL